jgi:predicted enzyme related to lactoylglutathione lyase
MSRVASRLREVVVDCIDPAAVAEFWGRVLGWDPQREDDFYWMTEPGADEATGLALVFVPVEERKAAKSRLHIDVSPVGCDQEEELDRLLSLGAVRADVGQGEQSWVVLADPEGNEFCLLRSRIG